MMKRRGAVLIVVLGVLALLALLATTFATYQMTERQVSRNYLDLVRAKLLAMSGVEHASAELKRMNRQNSIPASGPRPERYWGDDVDEEGPLGTPADLTQKLEKARNPSFAVETDMDPTNSTVTPRPVKIDGTDRGFSGVMSSGTYARNGDLYVLKVADAAAKIFVNEGVNHYQGNGSTASQNLKRILNHLGNAVTPQVAGLGDKVLANRPASGGYQIVLELKKFLTNAEYAAVADLLTAHTWVDPNVVHPVPFTAAQAAAIKTAYGIDYYRGSPAVYRFGRGKDYLNAAFPALYSQLKIYPSDGSNPFPANSLQHAVYAMDELNPQWIEVTSRAPVNVNGARREVLIALLADLKGVFMSERRRNNIETSVAGGYHYVKVKHTYSPDNMPIPPETPESFYNVPEGDELGFLYETWPIRMPTGTKVANEIYADTIADHILACRERKAFGGFNYGGPTFVNTDGVTQELWWNGPFRTWRQFNTFVDNLVTIGVLNDPRPIFFDHPPGPIDAGNITGYTTPLMASDFQRRVASRAIADVLKANFNPNLHLNELNPDRNLFTLVDKTDLAVNSTEFIFTPTGYYDVESVGRVLRPATGDDTLAPGINNELIAEAKIHAGVQLFDLIRETNQQDFMKGDASRLSAAALWATNNNRSLEVGPEPDNGNGPQENRWGGYIAFPTLGGNYTVAQVPKVSGGAPLPTPAGTAELGEQIHAHLSWDFDAHYHSNGNAYRKDMGSNNVGPADNVTNFPDPGETAGGPYDPVDNGGNYYRLARSFVLPLASSGTTSLPALPRRASEDLRIDGGYNERHSGLAYWINKASYAANTAAMKGVVSYWIKPNFDPARSGKPRLYMDLTRRSVDTLGGMFNEASFSQFWNAGHDALPGSGAPPTEGQKTWDEAGGSPTAPLYGPLPIKPQSMLFGVGYGWATGFASSGMPQYDHVVQSPCLNHEAHGDNVPSIFKGREWTHIMLSWIKNPSEQLEYTNPTGVMSYYEFNPPDGWKYKMLVNGQLLPGGIEMFYHSPTGMNDTAVDWTLHRDNSRNSLRIGSPSRIDGEGPFNDNFSADSTIDEIYFWNSNSVTNETNARQQWIRGRYSFPKDVSEGVFTSQPLALSPATNRALAPASSVTPPPGGGTIPPSGTTSSVAQAEILGISWTWFAEGSGKPAGGAWVPTLADRNPNAPGTLYPTVEASLVQGGVSLTPPVTNDGFSELKDSFGNPIQVAAGSAIQYRFKLGLPGADPLNTVLLTTPVVDDVTLYVSYGPTYTYYFYSGQTP